MFLHVFSECKVEFNALVVTVEKHRDKINFGIMWRLKWGFHFTFYKRMMEWQTKISTAHMDSDGGDYASYPKNDFKFMKCYLFFQLSFQVALNNIWDLRTSVDNKKLRKESIQFKLTYGTYIFILHALLSDWPINRVAVAYTR